MIPRRRVAVDAGAFARAWLEAKDDPFAAIERFEQAFAQWTGRRFAVTACSGRTTLLSALRAAGAEEGTEVILPAYTLADLPSMLRKAGMIPVFVDVDADSYLLDASSVDRAITPRTRAIIPTDIFGFTAHWDDLLGNLSRSRKIPLIEDAAHAAGSTLLGRPVGWGCNVAFFSLETIKVLHSFGGGVVVTDDEALAQSIRARMPEMPVPRSYVPKKFARSLVENLMFRTPAYQVALMARGNRQTEELLLSIYNRVKYSGVLSEYAYTGWQAAFAMQQLEGLDERIRRRRTLAHQMMEALSDLLVFPKEMAGVVGNYYFLVGRTDLDPQSIQKALVRAGVDTGVRGEITDFCPPDAERDRYPNAYRAFRSLLQLPFYEGMTEREIERVISAVREAFAQSSSKSSSKSSPTR
jgi:dTDP-4-amino-4,6-dideoxygalactose transaminase